MPCSTPYGRCMYTSCKRQNKLMPPEKGVDKGPQPLMFNPALTTQGELPRWGKRRPPGGCASERMKTQRFSYFADFAARRPAAAGQFRPVSRGGTSCFLREAKPVKLKKVAFSHFFDTLKSPQCGLFRLVRHYRWENSTYTGLSVSLPM